MNFCITRRSQQMDHFTSGKSQDRDDSDLNYLHLFLSLPSSPVLLTREAVIVPASCFSKMKKYVASHNPQKVEFVI